MLNLDTEPTSTPWDTIIIGGGVAGLSAALMLGRARRRILVLDAGAPRNRFAAHMHAVLGHEGIHPTELLRTGRADASTFGVAFADASVTRVEDAPGESSAGEPGPGELVVTTDAAASYRTRTLILATGITDRLPDIAGLADHWGTNVLHCPYCHGWEVRDRRLGVLATSPMALHQVQLLRQWSDDVVFFAAGAGPLDASTRTRLGARGIRIIDQPVVEVLGNRAASDNANALTGVRLADGTRVDLDAIFTGGVPEPHDRMLEPLHLERTDGPMGNMIAVDAVGLTSDPRIWAAGNVVNPAANVPASMGAGSFTGAAVNAALVTREFDAAVATLNGDPAGVRA
jgi:thioredoxin reductase